MKSGRARLAAHLDAHPVLRAILWSLAAGVLFGLLNAMLRYLALRMNPFEVQFLRYSAGVLVLAPWVIAAGWRNYLPHSVRGQMWRGAVHTAGLLGFFAALPRIPLADGTAIAFIAPMFTMIGAAWFLGERMIGARWVAAIVGFAGVVIVLWPKLQGGGGLWALVMLGAQPLFAASFIITKMLTRQDRVEVIVAWQAITVALFTLPFALLDWTWPSGAQWVIVLGTGVIGSTAHYALTRAVAGADLSALQSTRFLDLLWATLLGYAVFGDATSVWTFAGGLVIVGATVWIARYESRARPAPG